VTYRDFQHIRHTQILEEKFEAQIHNYLLKKMAVKPEVSTGHRMFVACLFVFLALQPIVVVFSQPGSWL
jgi:hypothetical protein